MTDVIFLLVCYAAWLPNEINVSYCIYQLIPTYDSLPNLSHTIVDSCALVLHCMLTTIYNVSVIEY